MNIDILNAQLTENQYSQLKETYSAQLINQYLIFLVGGEAYGIDILSVKEIRRWELATVIPNSPAYIYGVINIRGAIVPLIDLRKKFGLASIKYTATTVVIILKIVDKNKEKMIGILVDAVLDVYSLQSSQIHAIPNLAEHSNRRFIVGLGQAEDKTVILLNLNEIL